MEHQVLGCPLCHKERDKHASVTMEPISAWCDYHLMEQVGMLRWSLNNKKQDLPRDSMKEDQQQDSIDLLLQEIRARGIVLT